jgi:alpha-tubulin suppressor-like RCC1 family protein
MKNIALIWIFFLGGAGPTAVGLWPERGVELWPQLGVELWPGSGVGQGPTQRAESGPWIVGLGEYQCYFISRQTGKLFGLSASPGAVGAETGIPETPVAVGVPRDRRMTAVASGLHHSLAADSKGDVWAWGANDMGQEGNGTVGGYFNKPVQIGMDSLGRPFTGVIQIVCWYNYIGVGSGAVKSDGTVWVWGNTGGGLRGDGQNGQVNTKPVQVTMPKGKKIIKLAVGEVAIALASDGTVWTWGGYGRKEMLGTGAEDFRRPHQVILPQPAKDIAGNGMFNYALGVKGVLYGWGVYSSYMGIGQGGYMASNSIVPAPRDLTNDLKLPHPIVVLSINSVSTHVILSDSTLWGWGDNAMGCVGNGQELDYSTYKTPYAWDWGPGQLLQQSPVRLAPGVHNFTHVFGATAAVYYCYAETARGQLYSWGRNKAGVLGNGIMSATPDIEATYPNSWDVTTVTPVDPFLLKSTKKKTSPYCVLHPDGHPCDEFKIPHEGGR